MEKFQYLEKAGHPDIPDGRTCYEIKEEGERSASNCMVEWMALLQGPLGGCALFGPLDRHEGQSKMDELYFFYSSGRR